MTKLKWVLIGTDQESTSVLGLFDNRESAVWEMESYVAEAIHDLGETVIIRGNRWEDDVIVVNDLMWQTVAITETTGERQ